MVWHARVCHWAPLLCASCFGLQYACTNPPGSVAAGWEPAVIAGEFQEVAVIDWELAGGTEKYICLREVLTETTVARAWRSLAPKGTHHSFLSLSEAPDGVPDGVSECDAATIGAQQLFLAAVSTEPDRAMPPGIGMKLPEGSQLLLNVHLFNVTDQPLRGRSGALAQLMEEKDVVAFADNLSAGPTRLEIPPGPSTQHGTCTIGRDMTIFAVGPHMHQTGVAMQVVAHTRLYGDRTLFDGPFFFDDQHGYALDLLQLSAGDTVDITCTYENPSPRTLHWGGSSNDEMCSASLIRFPAGGSSFCNK